mmetsp:Transcript_31369/g.63780  ORF Transcript_31369/g.63780 Transcript_31369/m.63780 type:complete len:123 (-) Transcript_31369:55-423(-)
MSVLMRSPLPLSEICASEEDMRSDIFLEGTLSVDAAARYYVYLLVRGEELFFSVYLATRPSIAWHLSMVEKGFASSLQSQPPVACFCVAVRERRMPLICMPAGRSSLQKSPLPPAPAPAATR